MSRVRIPMKAAVRCPCETLTVQECYVCKTPVCRDCMARHLQTAGKRRFFVTLCLTCTVPVKQAEAAQTETPSGPNRGVMVSPEMRLAIYRRDGWRCLYCLQKFGHEHLTLDHIRPRSRGGTCHPGNLVTACRPCNIRRGNKPIEISAPKVKLQRIRSAIGQDMTSHLTWARKTLRKKP